MLLEIYSTNFALTKELSIESNVIPRVGETVSLAEGQDGGYLQGTTELLVYEVDHVLSGDALMPIVRCVARNGALHRRELLEEQGWL